MKYFEKHVIYLTQIYEQNPSVGNRVDLKGYQYDLEEALAKYRQHGQFYVWEKNLGLDVNNPKSQSRYGF